MFGGNDRSWERNMIGAVERASTKIEELYRQFLDMQADVRRRHDANEDKFDEIGNTLNDLRQAGDDQKKLLSQLKEKVDQFQQPMDALKVWMIRMAAFGSLGLIISSFVWQVFGPSILAKFH